MGFRKKDDELVIFIGTKRVGPESTKRWCDKIVNAVQPSKKDKKIKKIISSYRVTGTLTGPQACALQVFYNRQQAGGFE